MRDCAGSFGFDVTDGSVFDDVEITRSRRGARPRGLHAVLVGRGFGRSVNVTADSLTTGKVGINQSGLVQFGQRSEFAFHGTELRLVVMNGSECLDGGGFASGFQILEQFGNGDSGQTSYDGNDDQQFDQ